MPVALIIDDEQPVLEAVKEMLRLMGWNAVQATRGTDALKTASVVSPDLIITDVSMPDIDGMELLRLLRKREPAVPTIVISGNPVGVRFLRSAELLGARAVLTKPFTQDQLEEAMKKAMQ